MNGLFRFLCLFAVVVAIGAAAAEAEAGGYAARSFAVRAGINAPTENGLAALLVSGIDLYASGNAQQAIEAFHLTDASKEIRRNNEDYALAVLAVNGLDTYVNASAYKDAIDIYGASLSLERVAAELYVSPERLRYVLLWTSQRNIDLGVRAPALLAGWKMPRATFEVLYPKLLGLLKHNWITTN